MKLRLRGPDAFAEKMDEFQTRLETGRSRTAKLLGPTPELLQEPDVLRDALAELRVQHEELIVAEEELRAQVEELGRVSIAFEAERVRYADLFDRAPDPFLVTDRAAVVRDANSAACTLLGLELRFQRGKPLGAFVDRTSVRLTTRGLAVSDTGNSELIPLVVKPRNGAEVALVAHVSATSRGQRLLWILREGAPTVETSGPASSAMDRVLRDKEELLARERQRCEELERANRAKDRFIAVLSHDLRAPLNAVLGWTQMLRRETLDGAARSKALETIERNARTQANLIEELLDISRMEADQIQLSLSPVDLPALARRAVEGALPKALEAGISLTCSADVQLTVIGDVERLQQVLANLLSNALKHTPPGGHIDVEVRATDGRAELFVRDSGKGIDPKLLPLVFEMYMQERGYASSRSGLGLGLYIAKRFVALHGGTISVESAGRDRGATFTVSLPAAVQPETSLPAEPALRVPVSLGGLRVLVVDDESDARELITDVLTRAGADVAAASGSGPAMQLFSSWAPDVIVSDLAMPGVDGCELVARARAQEPSIGAVVVSGYTADDDTKRALAAGFDVHVAKPIESAELVEAVSAAARMRHR